MFLFRLTLAIVETESFKAQKVATNNAAKLVGNAGKVGQLRLLTSSSTMFIILMLRDETTTNWDQTMVQSLHCSHKYKLRLHIVAACGDCFHSAK